MSIQFVVENGVLVRRLFIGPVLPADYKPSIAKVLVEYENVNDSTHAINNIKEQQQSIAASEILVDRVKTDTHKKKTIRRRRKFVYHAADEVIAKGYWKTDKRSLTKFHSNSLMFEYSVVK